ncbi:hypothetical protein ACHAXA_007996 [Cyclostephanos tholiformis]|uniref:Uncharacterized protein n=1 Tax=Cyclostephanos tholiformis TaxID=382380 RepID=A0ABD3RGR7_9STRA
MSSPSNGGVASGPTGGGILPPPRPLQMGAKGAYIVRLLMVGDSSCGKTSLVLRFDQNVFSTKFVTTIGVDYRDKMVKIEGAPMRLQLWDTAGQERFRSLTSNFFGRADGFVLCYDISNRPSFDHVIGWMRDIRTRAPPDCDIVLCGNKSDLDGDRVVGYDEGKALADEYGVQFYETSALTGNNVEVMFNSLATTIKRRRIDECDGGGGGRGGGGPSPVVVVVVVVEARRRRRRSGGRSTWGVEEPVRPASPVRAAE